MTLLHAAPIPMPLPKHGKRSRRCENLIVVPYSFLAKRCMPALIWARSRRRWPADGRRRRRSWPPAIGVSDNIAPLLGMTHTVDVVAPERPDTVRVLRELR